jgi:hypothetical protein
MNEADKQLSRRIRYRTGLDIPEIRETAVPFSRHLAQYARDMRQFEEDRKARLEAEAAEAAKPQPQSLPDQLKTMIGQQQPQKTWAEVRAELDRRTEARQQRSLVDELKQALGTQEQQEGEPPALNSQKLLEIAAGTTEMPHSTREAVANVLREHWDNQQ